MSRNSWKDPLKVVKPEGSLNFLPDSYNYPSQPAPYGEAITTIIGPLGVDTILPNYLTPMAGLSYQFGF